MTRKAYANNSTVMRSVQMNKAPVKTVDPLGGSTLF